MDDTKARKPRQGEATLPISFQALAVEDEGKPIILQTRRIGELNDDDVLVRVDYASINNMDAGLARRNRPVPRSAGRNRPFAFAWQG